MHGLVYSMGKPKPRKSKGWRKQHKQWARNKNHIAKRDSERLAAAAREELLSAPTTAISAPLRRRLSCLRLCPATGISVVPVR